MPKQFNKLNLMVCSILTIIDYMVLCTNVYFLFLAAKESAKEMAIKNKTGSDDEEDSVKGTSIIFLCSSSPLTKFDLLNLKI